MQSGGELSPGLWQVGEVRLEHSTGSEGLDGGCVRVEEIVDLATEDYNRVWGSFV